MYLLFEHKSFVEKNIHLQLGRYLFEIYHKQQQEQKRLMPVVPLVLYHGKNKWSVKENFIDIFSLPQEQREQFQRYIPNFAYALFDVGKNIEPNTKRSKQEKIDLQSLSEVILYSLSYVWEVAKEQKLEEFFRLVARALLQQDRQDELLERLLLYFFQFTDVEIEAISRIISNELSKEKGDNIMTTAERLEKRGLERGRQEGLYQGRSEGLEEGMTRGSYQKAIEAARKLKQKSMDIDFICEVTGLSQKEIAEL